MSGNNQELDQIRKMGMEASRYPAPLKTLQRTLLGIEDVLQKGFADHSEKEALKEQLMDLGRQFNATYEKLEDDAKTQSPQTPQTSRLARLNAFLQEVATDSTIPDAAENYRDAFDWLQSTASHLNYLSDFQKHPFYMSNSRGRRLLSVANTGVDPPLVRIYNPLDSPHARFEKAVDFVLDKFAKDHHNRMRYTSRYLERSTLNSVIELQLICNSRRGDYVTSDRQPVVFFKCLILVNNGLIDFCQFIAPHEDWHYLETSPSQVDIGIESRYHLYRSMSTQANIISRHFSSMADEAKSLYQFLSFILRFYVIEDKCVHCKRLLKDFIPTMMNYLEHSGKASFHSNCK